MKIRTKLSTLRRPLLAMVACVLTMSGAIPSVLLGTSYANGQVQTRSIQIGNSSVGALTTYKVTFTPATAGQSLVIDFCQDSAIIGASCNTTNGVTFSSATVTNGNLTGTPSITTSGSTLKLTTTSAWSSGTSYNFTINGVNNPTGTSSTVGAVGSFYGRLYTYSNATYGTPTAYASPTAIGSNIDYGGFALSTANNVTISATVMETLTFCVSKVAPGNGCTATTAPSLTLGSGSPLTLGTTFSTDTAYTQLSTNALSGAAVGLYATSSTACSGLSRDNGVSCGIAAIGNSAIAAGSLNGTGQFGLNVGGGTGGTGTVSATAPYATAGSYAMATNAYTAPSQIESSSGATANVNSLLTYGASATVTTPAGVYTSTEALIATGTF